MFTPQEESQLKSLRFITVFKDSNHYIGRSPKTRQFWQVIKKDGRVLIRHKHAPKCHYHKHKNAITIETAVKRIKAHEKAFLYYPRQH